MIQVSHRKHILKFKFDAGTSRGVLKEKETWILKLALDEKVGFGECGPIRGLAVDNLDLIEEEIERVGNQVPKANFSNEEQVFEFLKKTVSPSFPSVRFGFETALLDLLDGGKWRVFSNDFYDYNKPLPINGLVWMGNKAFMKSQIETKIKAGFNCIKIKIGAIDLAHELEVLSYIRELDPDKKLTIRLDANGAFTPENAIGILEKLSVFDIHSIEQPIKPGQFKAMNKLCQESPIPIALDEELIGIYSKADKIDVLENINPPYIILKPTLVGGIQSTREWISLAEERGIKWWITSALESNIGLNAICQLTSTYHPTIPQGLGTGQLYNNNFDSPLEVSAGEITYRKGLEWEGNLR